MGAPSIADVGSTFWGAEPRGLLGSRDDLDGVLFMVAGPPVSKARVGGSI